MLGKTRWAELLTASVKGLKISRMPFKVSENCIKLSIYENIIF